MAYENILYQVEEGIATITFNRPKALNALNQALLKEFYDALNVIDDDENIRVLILTGSGEKSFVAGADITEIAVLNTLEAKFFATLGHKVIGKLQELSIPVIAAVNGFALGGGNEIAIACDFIYAAENAKFGLPETNLGVIPGFGGTQRLPRLVGKNMAKEMIFTGKMLSAAEAKEIGLVNKVCKPEELLAEAGKTAGMMAAKGKISLKLAKQVINTGMDVDLATANQMEIDSFALCVASVDAKEGTAAFLEKRKAVFQGTLKG